MATTLTTTPNELNLAGNPVIIAADSSIALITIGRYDILQMQFSRAAQEGEWIDITLNGETFRFNIVDGASDNAQEVPGTTSGGFAIPTSTWTGYFLEKLQAFYFISLHYIISSPADDVIQFRSINKTDANTVSYDHGAGSFITTLIDQTGQSQERRDNHKVVFKLLIEQEFGSNKFNTPIDIEVPAIAEDTDSSGSSSTNTLPAQVNINNFLSAFLEHYVPDILTTDVIQTSAAAVVRYRIFHTDYSDIPAVYSHWNVPTTLYHAIIGRAAFPFTVNNANFLTYLQSNKWLSWSPIKKYLAIDQPDWLGYLPLVDDTVHAQIKITYTDLTIDNWADFDTIAATAYKPIYIPVGHAEIVSDLLTGEKELLKWQIRLTDGTDPLTPEQTYYIQTSIIGTPIVLGYHNTLGVFTSIFLNADYNENTTVQGNLYPRDSADQSPADHDLLPLLTGSTNTITVGTGHLTPAQNGDLVELMLSEKAYWLLDGTKYPITITNRSVASKRERKNLVGNTISFVVNQQNLAFSK